MVHLVWRDPFQNLGGGGTVGSAICEICPSIGIERGIDKQHYRNHGGTLFRFLPDRTSTLLGLLAQAA
jgi:hypothetical protein